MHHPFTFFSALGVPHEFLHVVTSGFVVLLLVLATAVLYPRLAQAQKNVLPSGRFGLSAIFEILLDMLTRLCDDIIGSRGRSYLPLLGTIFLFLFVSNLLGLIPGFLPPTSNWVTGAAVATVSFLAFNLFGFQAHGVGYFKHFLAPVSPGPTKSILAWLLLILPITALHALFGAIEVISVCFRPITLAIRLYANITADHAVLEIFSGILPYLLPLPFLVLGIFVSFMQAFIFTLLTMVYISGAVAHAH